MSSTVVVCLVAQPNELTIIAPYRMPGDWILVGKELLLYNRSFLSMRKQAY